LIIGAVIGTGILHKEKAGISSALALERDYLFMLSRQPVPSGGCSGKRKGSWCGWADSVAVDSGARAAIKLTSGMAISVHPGLLGKATGAKRSPGNSAEYFDLPRRDIRPGSSSS
jgi:hypothetical protein